MFSISLFFPFASLVFAAEIIFDDPIFLEISGTASQGGGVLNTYPIAWDSSNSPEQYCIEKGLYLAYYTTEEPSPFGEKAWYNTSTGLWFSTSTITKSVSQITCTNLPIIGQISAGWIYANNYWNESFPWFGSGSIEGILIKARVNPTLDMAISVEEIDLGALISGTTSTGSLSIEIGTNAINGVSITARSQSGGLTNTSDALIQINTNTPAADPVASESYTWASTIGTSDSSLGTFIAENATGNGLDSAVEITENSTEYNVYTTNKPESITGIDDVTFHIAVTPQGETPAGDYEDRVIFTVTGNF